MIGTGYVGLVSGACFSDLGNSVICVDKDTKKIDNLKKGIIPIFEPGLDELVKKNYKSGKLKFTSNLKESVLKSDIIFICVGTPTKRNSNAADLTQIYKLAKEISKYSPVPYIFFRKIFRSKSKKKNNCERFQNLISYLIFAKV